MNAQYRRTPGIEASPLQEESILFDPATNRFCLLNRTAAFLWERLDAPASADDLVQAVCDAFDGADQGRVAPDVQATLAQLVELKFVAVQATA